MEDTPATDESAAPLDDARTALSYLVAPESSQYIAIMDVLELSLTDLTPVDVHERLRAGSFAIDQSTVEARLDKLRLWGAASARTDSSRILRHADLLARNWRYTATPVGRQIQRFYRKVLAHTPTVREIPLTSLSRLVEAIEALASCDPGAEAIPELIGQVFVHHDDLDAALVGAEDSLATLVDRFDLDDDSTAELKALLVGYATHVAATLEHGSARALAALSRLRVQFDQLAAQAVGASEARVLIERGALGASHGGRAQDWQDLFSWFDPISGRSARFALRLVRALPGMHMNLRRLHSSSGAATSRSRALELAKACGDERYGSAIFMAALGDHSWRKLHGESDDSDLVRVRSWRDGPFVEVPELLRITGRSGPRGRPSAARDDTEARAQVLAARARRAAEHAAAIKELIGVVPGPCVQVSEAGARVALAALLVAVKARSTDGIRTGVRDGLRCTLFHIETVAGVLVAPTWRIVLPGRLAVFHLPDTAVALPAEHVAPHGRANASGLVSVSQ